jgi:hypothetical protein
MKRQKILIDVRHAMERTPFGSIQRNDALLNIRKIYMVSPE